MMAGEKKQRRIDRIDGRTVLFLTLCACLVTFLTTSFWGHGIFTFWIFLILCWFGLYKQAIGCFAVYLVAIVWLMIETKYQISIPSGVPVQWCEHPYHQWKSDLFLHPKSGQ